MDWPTCFVSALPSTTDDDLVVHLDSSLTDRDALFDEFSRKLSFPDYFGRNWDALYDCINDLDWITQRRVFLCYASLPNLPPAELEILVRQLESTVQRWKSYPQHELIVVVEHPPAGHERS